MFRDAAPRPEQTFSYLSQMAAKLDKGADFETFCVAWIQENKPDVTSVVAPALADWYVGLGNNEQALETLTAQLNQGPEFSPPQIVLLANKTTSILMGKLFRYEEAVEVLSNAIHTVSAQDPNAFASLANAQAAILQKNLANPNAAETRVREVIALGDRCPVLAFTTASELLASILSEKGDREGAVEALVLLLKRSDLPPSGIAQKIILIGATPTEIEASIRMLRLRMGQMPSDLKEFSARAERLQPEIVEFLLALGLRDEAVCESRVLVFSASDRMYPQAVELAAKSLKARDGNLSRANALLAFQSADDALVVKQKNVLLDFPTLNDDVRMQSYEALASAVKPLDWNEWLLRSAYLLWLDRPAEALDAAVEAFTLCPLSETALQTCAATIVRPILVAMRDSAVAQAVIDYMLFGALGRDGKAGTEDDRTDPFPGIREKLAFPTAPEVAEHE